MYFMMYTHQLKPYANIALGEPMWPSGTHTSTEALCQYRSGWADVTFRHTHINWSPMPISLWVSWCDLPAHTHHMKPYANIALGELMWPSGTHTSTEALCQYRSWWADVTFRHTHFTWSPMPISLWVSWCDLPAHTHQLKLYANIPLGEPMWPSGVHTSTEAICQYRSGWADVTFRHTHINWSHMPISLWWADVTFRHTHINWSHMPISLWVSWCDLPAHTHQLKPYANIPLGEPMWPSGTHTLCVLVHLVSVSLYI